MRHRLRLLVACCLLLASLGARAGNLTVAAAADLKFALEECVTAFRNEQPDIEVKAIHGSSGSIFAQIAHGAPFDLFLSADKKYPDALVADGHAIGKSMFSYAVGRLVVWVPNDSPIEIGKRGMAALRDPAAKKVAIANPDHAPYGEAAVAAMKSFGVYDDVKAKLVLGENIAQTAQFVEAGAADIGIIALSLALAPALCDKGRFWEVPQTAFPRLEQAGVIMRNAANPGAAARFADFLKSPTGKGILKRFGFVMPEEK